MGKDLSASVRVCVCGRCHVDIAGAPRTRQARSLDLRSYIVNGAERITAQQGKGQQQLKPVRGGAVESDVLA